MTKQYINTGFAPGHSDYSEITDVTHVGTVSFATKATNVKVGAATQRMTSVTLSAITPFGVYACDNASCEVGQLNESIKVQINCKFGSDSSITAMRAELNRLLDIWQANNMAYAVVPPVDTDLSGS